MRTRLAPILTPLITLLLLTGCTAGSGSPPASAETEDPGAKTEEPAAEQPPPESVTGATGWLAYQGLSRDGGPDAIFLTRADGSEEHEILDDVPGRRLHPDFSPDGAQLAFDQMDGGPDRLWISDANGTKAKPVGECEANDGCIQRWEPAWSPEGDRLAVSTTDGVGLPSTHGIAVVDVASGELTRLVEHPAAEGQDHFPRWSPDGESLVFWRGRSGENGPETAIFVVSASGGEATQLTDWDMLAGDPDWSPDGSRILFGTSPLLEFDSSGQSELYTMDPDGTDQRQLTDYGPDGPRATQPRWTPDGEAILYVRTTQEGHPRLLYAMSADGQNDGAVLDRRSVYTHPTLQHE